MTNETAPPPPTAAAPLPLPTLRLWPGVALLAVLCLARGAASIGEFSLPMFLFGLVFTPLGVLVGILVWWLSARRVPWRDRLTVLGCSAGIVVLVAIFDRTSFTGLGFVLYAVPAVATWWAGWLLATPWLNWPARRRGVPAGIAVIGVVVSLLRIDGWDGTFHPHVSLRLIRTPEEKFLSKLQPPGRPDIKPAAVELHEQPGDWPAFRGERRDGRLLGVRIKTDWRKSPPWQLWRHTIGPGWSSFAAIGNRLFTQEQRGSDECVTCYDATTGAELWSHADATRFSEDIAGPGPRATPTFHEGRLYTLGASGRLNCLHPGDGSVVWSRDIAADSGAEVPKWGFASSPLVTHGLVMVFAGGPGGKGVVAYHAASGEPAWSSGEGTIGYCSPQLATIDGTQQVLINTNEGMSAFDPLSGKVLWHHSWPTGSKARVIQPAAVGDHDFLLGCGMSVGTRRISVARDGDGWQTSEVWTTKAIKPYYNDMVVAGDHLYGFDGSTFMCVRLKDGQKIWHTSDYGNGQVLLLADQPLLMVVSETGEVALVAARPERFEELAKFQAIEGKTWNHPVVAHGKLFVRNGEEMAGYALEGE